MSELLLHFVIPFGITSHSRGWKIASLAGLAGVLPDSDVLLHVHRSWSHSLLVAVIASTFLLLLARSLSPGRIHIAYAVIFGLSTHLILDVFNGFSPILWPFLANSIFVDINGFIRISSFPSIVMSSGDIIERLPTSFQPFETLDGPLFTSDGLAISVILLLSSFLSIRARARKKVIQDPEVPST